MAINWDEMISGDFIVIKAGVPKVLVMKNWKEQTAFKDDNGAVRPGVEFDVVEEDGNGLSKIKKYTVTAKGALKLFQPICQKAEAEGKNSIKVEILGVGEGKARQYSIREVA